MTIFLQVAIAVNSVRRQLFVVNVGPSFLKLEYWKWRFGKKRNTENIEATGQVGIEGKKHIILLAIEGYCCCSTVNKRFGFKWTVKFLTSVYFGTQLPALCNRCIQHLLVRSSAQSFPCKGKYTPRGTSAHTVLYVYADHHPSAWSSCLDKVVWFLLISHSVRTLSSRSTGNCELKRNVR